MLHSAARNNHMQTSLQILHPIPLILCEFYYSISVPKKYRSFYLYPNITPKDSLFAPRYKKYNKKFIFSVRNVMPKSLLILRSNASITGKNSYKKYHICASCIEKPSSMIG